MAVDRYLSHLGVRQKTVGGFVIVVLMMMGFAVFSTHQLHRIGDDIKVLDELNEANAQLASAGSQLGHLNVLIHSFLRTREPADVKAALETSQALQHTVTDLFSREGPVVTSDVDRTELAADLAVHHAAITVAANAVRRHQDSVDDFLAATVPINTTIYAFGAADSAAETPEVTQTKARLQSIFTSGHGAMTRYIVSLQPADAEVAIEQLNAFATALLATSPTGSERFDRFVGYLRAKLPAYRQTSLAFVEAVDAENRAKREIERVSARLDDVFQDITRDFHTLGIATSAAQRAEVLTLFQMMLMVGTVASVIGFILSWVISGSIAGPILRITQTMHALAAGNLDVEIPALDYHDEIGRMAKATETFKRNAAALAASEARYRDLLANLMEGIVETTGDGHILSANPALAQIFGWPSPEAMLADGATIQDLLYVNAQDRASVLDALRHQDGRGQFEVAMKKRDGSPILVHTAIRAIIENDRIIRLEGSMVDVTERRAAEDRIRQLAFFDPLTGLANRRLLHERLAHAIAASRRENHLAALVLIDLDFFKKLNDTYGHARGDEYLVWVARRLAATTRESDTVARIGGDEFVVVLEDLPSRLKDAATRTVEVCQRILTALAPEEAPSDDFPCTASIGAALIDHNTIGNDEVLRQADIAMYQAKSDGRNGVRLFDTALQSAVNARFDQEKDIARGLRDGEFVLHFQPQLDSRRVIVGAEALLRWNHPQRGLVPPLDFIPLAEETGQIIALGEVALQAACAKAAQWARQRRSQPMTLSVNVSARQFHQADFVERVLSAIERAGTDPRMIILEVTETVLLANVDDVARKMRELKGRGVRFSLDDFGTGYSSLSYLSRLPFSQIKIDKSFVQNAPDDRAMGAIASAIVDLAHRLDLTVVAEGVETERQYRFFTDLHCHHYQGYWFDRPLDGAMMDTRLEASTLVVGG